MVSDPHFFLLLDYDQHVMIQLLSKFKKTLSERFRATIHFQKNDKVFEY